MRSHQTPQRLLVALALLLQSTLVLSQNISPQNGTLPIPQNAPQMNLRVTNPDGGMESQVHIDPLTQPAGAGENIGQLQNINITGTIRYVTPTTAQNLQAGDIAYISCEPSDYTGDLTPAGTVALAASKISPDSQLEGAILLYSTVSAWCIYEGNATINSWMIYTMTSASASATLQSGLSGSSAANAQATITIDNSSINNGTAATLSPSPTTAVAMIILYSITGIITALFLIIIVTGAIRAHRHPERYGPRIVPGRPRQSRAKGIARAMLESLPIVKFGEQEDTLNKPPVEGDLELAQRSTHNASPTGDLEEARGAGDGSVGEGSVGEGSVGEAPAREASASEEADGVATVKAEGIEASHEHPKNPAENNAENGLACSVCTDDFIKGQDIRVLPCNHKFHPECIDPWLLNVSGTCPLCRVDLRPTASPTTEEPDAAVGDVSVPMRGGMAPFPSTSPSDTASRRRSTGHGLGLLNIRRMRDATPEERVAALRGLRNQNRAENGGSEEAEPAAARTGRFSRRITRFWGHGSREGSVPAEGDVEQAAGSPAARSPAAESPAPRTDGEVVH